MSLQLNAMAKRNSLICWYVKEEYWVGLERQFYFCCSSLHFQKIIENFVGVQIKIIQDLEKKSQAWEI